MGLACLVLESPRFGSPCGTFRGIACLNPWVGPQAKPPPPVSAAAVASGGNGDPNVFAARPDSGTPLIPKTRVVLGLKP